MNPIDHLCSRALLAPALVFATVAGFSSNALADKVFVSDQGHTEVMFGWNHAGVTRQNGQFTEAVATVNLADDLADSTVEVEIATASVSSGFGPLDDHLKTADYLDVETYPTMTFKSTSIEVTGDDTMNVTGDLTLHGVTNEVTLETKMTLNGPHPLGGAIEYYQGDWVAFEATTEIDHTAFEVGSFNTGPIAITINTEMKAP